MYDNHTLERCDAMEWLAKNLVEWPAMHTPGEIIDIISSMWRFYPAINYGTVFCSPGNQRITESDFYNFLHNYAGTELVRYGNED